MVQFLKYYYVTKYTLSIILRTVDYIYTMQSAGFVSSKLIMKFSNSVIYLLQLAYKSARYHENKPISNVGITYIGHLRKARIVNYS